MITLLCASGSFSRAAQGPPAASPLQATLEVIRPFTYEGDPLLVRVAVFNTGDQPWTNSAGVNLVGGIKVVSFDGGPVEPKEKAQVDAKQQPAVIPPGGFFGVIHDVAQAFPGVAKAGTYTLSWAGAGITADAVTVKVLPHFDPNADYVAVIETDFGYMEFDLFARQAPRHVQNFYDLALQGFYDGSVLGRILKGVEVWGGDPTMSGGARLPYTLDLEVNKDLKHKRGTLSMVRLPGKTLDDGSQFVITLGPNEKYDGNLSIFGQLRKGEETLAAVENIPTTGQFDAPYFRPIKPVVVRSVTVKKADVTKPAAGAN